MTSRGHLLLAGLALVVTTGGDAAAEAYLRVIAQRASVHTGPGPGYREVYVAERDQVFTVLARGTRDFWFKIEL